MPRYYEYSIKSNPFGISPRPLPNTIQESRQRLRSSKLGDRSLRDRLTFARNMRELGALYSVVGLSREAIFSRGQSLQCCARFQVHRIRRSGRSTAVVFGAGARCSDNSDNSDNCWLPQSCSVSVSIYQQILYWGPSVTHRLRQIAYTNEVFILGCYF